jgi:LytS/YehU family sensor histidine kinase
MLNTLSGLIHKDLDKSDTFIYHFSLLYRYALRVEPEDVVPLSQELEFIEHFLFLNNIRFNDAISSQINISDQAQFIVPMALQLAFENAIKHNQFNKKNPLTIQVKDVEGYLVITNNKSKKSNPDPSSNIGIPILQARYARLCNVAIKIEDNEEVFSLFLPILKDAN